MECDAGSSLGSRGVIILEDFRLSVGEECQRLPAGTAVSSIRYPARYTVLRSSGCEGGTHKFPDMSGRVYRYYPPASILLTAASKWFRPKLRTNRATTIYFIIQQSSSAQKLFSILNHRGTPRRQNTCPCVHLRSTCPLISINSTFDGNRESSPNRIRSRITPFSFISTAVLYIFSTGNQLSVVQQQT